MVPTSRAEFRDYCLRELGSPVITINVDETQVEDRIDESLSMYAEHHFDAIERVYLKHAITDDNASNNYIDIPDAVRSVTRIFPLSGFSGIGPGSSDNPFNLNYQFRLSFNDLYSFFSFSMLDYYLYRRHMTLIDEMVVGQIPIRFSKHQNRLYVDGDWANVLKAGRWLIIECDRVLDPGTYADIWKDDWLKRYTVALIKRQWGSNMRKFQGVKLVGGIMMNGEAIYQEAKADLEELRFELRNTWEAPPEMMIG